MELEEASAEELAAFISAANATAEAIGAVLDVFERANEAWKPRFDPPKPGDGLSSPHLTHWPKDYHAKTPRPSRAVRHAIRTRLGLSNRLTGAEREVWLRYLYR